ncbi:hypothetical protein QT972_00075 [Microcoleus sp. herbarium7]|uniref:hypothetical protein n=1 Tax=Microcoleus sp. herbarium7 TaxID=3055435 RepID=UPI002FD6B93E
MHKSIQIIAAAVLSLTPATAVHAQAQQWVQISTSDSGDRIFFDLASQIKVFDAGYKENTFRTLALATTAGRRSFRQKYHANCLTGTLSLHGLDLVNAQGSLIMEIPLERANKNPIVPAKDTIAADIWRYACAQF